MAPAADALARLRILEHGVLPVDLVLHLEVVRIGRRPVEIQSRSNLPAFHLNLPSRYRCTQTQASRRFGPYPAPSHLGALNAGRTPSATPPNSPSTHATG